MQSAYTLTFGGFLLIAREPEASIVPAAMTTKIFMSRRVARYPASGMISSGGMGGKTFSRNMRSAIPMSPSFSIVICTGFSILNLDYGCVAKASKGQKVTLMRTLTVRRAEGRNDPDGVELE
jgi:methyl coenzyme M reductase alpha subunit